MIFFGGFRMLDKHLSSSFFDHWFLLGDICSPVAHSPSSSWYQTPVFLWKLLSFPLLDVGKADCPFHPHTLGVDEGLRPKPISKLHSTPTNPVIDSDTHMRPSRVHKDIFTGAAGEEMPAFPLVLSQNNGKLSQREGNLSPDGVWVLNPVVPKARVFTQVTNKYLFI